jgi:hypothetical protein
MLLLFVVLLASVVLVAGDFAKTTSSPVATVMETYKAKIDSLPYLPDDWLKGTVFHSNKATDLGAVSTLNVRQ